MKKILILSSGNVGENFIQRVIDTYTSENIYYVVEMKKTKEYEGINPARFKFFEFDPTSFYKLSNILKMEFIEVFIVLENKVDVVQTIKNIRLVKKSLPIVVLDFWGLEIQEGNISYINTKEILASKLIDYLPNVPVIAQNVGNGEGEIMEVLVPFGSSFVYKHLGVIEQKNWKIAAIYRKGTLLLPTRRRMIQPNDVLLLIGEPRVLKTVYRVIKQERGQFPEPYGMNIYVYIDMHILSKEVIYHLLDEAFYIQEKLEKELYIRIIHPNDIELLRYIKDQLNSQRYLYVEYEEKDDEEILLEDKNHFHIGLILVTNEIFYTLKMRNILYKTYVPILKVAATKTLAELKDVSLVLSDNKDPEKISNTIFDFSEQFELNIEIYNYINEHQDLKEEVIEHYYNLSTIFSKSIKVYKQEENPIRILQKKQQFLHVVPFSQKLLSRIIYSYFTTDSDLMYHHLQDHPQMFIPVDDI